MRKLAAIALALALVVPGAAAAQQLPSYTITLNQSQWNQIWRVLAKEQYGDVHGLIEDIQGQMTAQEAKAAREQRKAMQATIDKAVADKAAEDKKAAAEKAKRSEPKPPAPKPESKPVPTPMPAPTDGAPKPSDGGKK